MWVSCSSRRMKWMNVRRGVVRPLLKRFAYVDGDETPAVLRRLKSNCSHTHKQNSVRSTQLILDTLQRCDRLLVHHRFPVSPTPSESCVGAVSSNCRLASYNAHENISVLPGFSAIKRVETNEKLGGIGVPIYKCREVIQTANHVS